MMLVFAESGHPIFRLQAQCPEVDSEAKYMEHCRYTIVPIWKRLKTIFRIIISVNQLSLHGAVAEMCEEYETLHDRTLWEDNRVPHSYQA